MRLEDDNLETDISGLELAANKAFRHIPKIILTSYPMEYKDQRKVWEPIGGEPPAVVAFVGKDEMPQILLREIRHAFDVWPRITMLSSKVSEQIKADHYAIQSRARWNYGLSLIISVFGFGIIVTGIILVWMGKLDVGIVASVTGLILETLGFLFFTRLDFANKRMDIYHQELLQTYGLEFLLLVTERLPSDRENVYIERAVYAIIDSWYPASSRPARDLLPTAEVEIK